KNNTRPPAKRASWYRFEGVTLANGDGVGVVTAWDCPDSATPGASKADELFLRILDRLSLEGRQLNNISGPNYAPAVFAQQPEAKAAKIGKAALTEAMQRLFATGTIKMEDCGRPSRPAKRIVRVSPVTAPAGD